MKYIRGLIAVVVGYLFMAGTSMIMVRRMFAEGVPEPEQNAIVMACLGLALGAAVGGVLCTFIVGVPNSPAIYIAIGVVIAVTARGFAMDLGVEPDWYRIASTVALAIGFMVGASAAAYRLEAR